METQGEEAQGTWRQRLEWYKPTNAGDCQCPPEARRESCSKYPVSASRKNQPAWHLDFHHVLRDHDRKCFHYSKPPVWVLCSGSPEKLIHCRESCFILLIETLDRKCYSNPFTNFGKLGNAYQNEKTLWIQRPLINFFTILIFFPSILQRIYFTLIWSHLH